MRSLTIVAILALTLVLAFATVGCGPSEPAEDPTALEGVEWQLVASSLSSANLAPTGVTAMFEKGQMSGFSGVNRYSGEYTAKEDGSFEAGPFAGTLMAGPETLMKAEAAYLAALEECDRFEIDVDGRLTLHVGGDDTLVYEAAKAVELPGTMWTVTNYNNGKEAVVGVVEGSQLTLEFLMDGTVSGNGGVNSFSGPFESTDKTVKIGPLASTMMAGDQALMDQEAQYTAALEASVQWSVVNGTLELRDAEGALQVMATTKP